MSGRLPKPFEAVVQQPECQQLMTDAAIEKTDMILSQVVFFE